MLKNVLQQNKYHNIRSWSEFCQRQFASIAERRRGEELRMLEMNGHIQSLEYQPRYALVVNGIKVGTYVADFRYVDEGAEVVEDVKSVATVTPVYRIKKRLMKALYEIEILDEL